MEREELAGWLRLALTSGIGNGAARRLLAAFGLPASIFTQAPSALDHVATPAQVQALLTEPPELAALAETTWKWLHEPGVPAPRRLVVLGDSAYPPALLQTEDPPLMLYVMGTIPTAWPPGIAMVGSRNPTAQGVTNARQFAASFAQAGLTVVSGMALGVDAAAHEGALDAASEGQLATIAVVGTGLDLVYPRQHHDLAHRISQRGLLVSEYPLGTPPLPPNFPKRNRIIAALGRGTVVVEAALKSGSLITAKQALEQGKDVFAIPGSIHSPQSRGCHALLKQGAKLVETAQDVLEELPSWTGTSAARTDAPTAESESESESDADDLPEDSLLTAMAFDPVTLDALVARTGIGAASLQARLLDLELRGDVARLPGGLFQRIGSA
jgi:DNA processing protein